jgi:hypothetical protein
MDSHGNHHLYRTVDETVLVVAPDAGRVVERADVSDRSVDDWMQFVDEECDGYEWANRSYHRSVTEWLDDAFESADDRDAEVNHRECPRAAGDVDV